MLVRVVRIGNSRGIRIPKAVLEQCGVSDAVDLQVEGSRIVLVPARARPRQGWEEALGPMAASGEDHLLIDDAIDSGDLPW